MSDPGTTVMPVHRKPAGKRRRGRDTEPQERIYGLLAEFETPAAIYSAAEKVRDAGYRWWDCHTPFPVHGLDAAMGVKRTILPVLVFGAGATGALLGLALQWFTNATNFKFWGGVWVTGYQYLVSGKPPWSLPANVPVIFELMVLFAAVGCVILMLLLNKLPQLYHPVFKSERFARASDDRFFIVIEARDPQFYRNKTEEFLESLGATAVEALEE